MRTPFTWDLGRRTLPLGQRTVIMGVVNVTPDSFSDGGQFLDASRAVEHAMKLLEEGADVLDVGGESTRPGARVSPGLAAGSSGFAAGVSAREELDRILPVIEGILTLRPEAVVSIDTYKAEVARAAVQAGALIVNDVSAFRWDPQMAATVAELGCGCILMHMRGRPEEWRSLPPEPDIVGLVERELRDGAQAALEAGIRRERIVLDPGFGFGKNFEQNYPLLAHLARISALGFPVLAATSRKSFIGRTVGHRLAELGGTEPQDVAPAQRLNGTLATVVAAVLNGAHVVRVHDVRPAVEAVAIADAILGTEK
ncbi:MAG TPA: dihydropteroate synthase [Clostridia bacterium]|nr:dihydropteroate synthase [Clostridia bacterium]